MKKLDIEFVKLNNVRISEVKDNFFLDTLLLEEEMTKHNGGINLSYLESNHKLGDELVLRSHVPYFFENETSKEDFCALIEKYPNITSPCSMLIDSLEEMEQVLSIAYKTSHFHYILGKKYNMGGSFPKFCCGSSGRGVMLSLIKLGYPNASYACSKRYDHSYTIMPFIFGKEKIAGTIIVDPTADQLWDNKQDKRNTTFIKLGNRWTYITDWKNNADLFPNRILSVDRLPLASKDLSDFYNYHKQGTNYLTKAFNNPLKFILS